MNITRLKVLHPIFICYFVASWSFADPRLNFVLSNLSPEQRNALSQHMGTVSPSITPAIHPQKNEASKEKRETGADPSGTEMVETEPKTEDKLKQLLFLEQLLVQDLENYELRLEEYIDEDVHSPVDEIELLQSIEETQNLLRQIKKEQRVEVSRLASVDTDENDQRLKPFGFDFFQDQSADETNTLEHIPADYQVGPGDILEILLFGQRNSSHSLLINRDGIIQFPDVGPINVFEKDRDFLSIKNTINQKIQVTLGNGVQSSITLGVLRSVPVFIVGQVNAPGRYTISPHSSITSAIRKAGGVTEKGSVRTIALMRNGQEVSSLDLYDLLIRGDDSADQKIISGDVIFVPTVGNQVLINGEVNIPALFEIKDKTTLSSLISMAGGFSPYAYSNKIAIQRNNSFGRYDLRTLDFTADQDFLLKGGDIVEVPRTEKRFVDAVQIMGPVEREGYYQWHKGMQLSDLLSETGFLLKDADLSFAYVVRSDEVRNLSILKFHPREILSNDSDLPILPEDQIVILSKKSGFDRFQVLKHLNLELKKQTPSGKKAQIVSVSGEVHFPGEFPLAEGMSISDLVMAAGGLTDSAYGVGAELTRMNYDQRKYSKVEHIRVESSFYTENNSSEPFILEPYDRLNIKPIPLWSTGNFVHLEGEVNFPGSYQIARNESIQSLIDRAGGLTENAFEEGAFFTRENLKVKEQKELERLMNQLQADLATSSLDALNSAEVLRSKDAANSMMKRLESTEPVGRMVIDLASLLKKDSKLKLQLQDGDKLIIPSYPSSVSVMGEVNFSTSHMFRTGLSRDDYIALSGGTTDNAAENNIFVVKADGSVFSNNTNRWFESKRISEVEAGDVIVVPIDVKQSRFLEQMSYTSQIIYQMAVAAAAVNSF